MKKSDTTNWTLEQKVDYLIERVDSIDRVLHPPLWKQCLKWALDHWVLIMGLMALGYGLWQIWTIVSASIEAIQSLSNAFSSFGKQLTDPVQNTLDIIPLDKLKFW